MKEWMARADPPKEACTVKKMNGWSLLLSTNKMTHYFKKQTTASGALKNKYCTYNDLMLQIDPLNSSCFPVAVNYCTPKENLGYKYSERAPLLKKVAVPKVTLGSANVYNCSSKRVTI